MIDSWSNYCDHLTSSSEQGLYDHLINCVETKQPNEVIDHFRQLFIDGVGCTDQEIWQTVEELLTAEFADREFKFTINRSCYILINRWLMQPRLHAHIPELISLFETAPTGLARSRTAKRLRSLIQDFVISEQYLSLKRLMQVMAQAAANHTHEAVPLGSLIQRYPCLYEYSLLTEDSTSEQRRQIALLRSKAQRRFEIDLSHYVTHQHRCRLRNPLGQSYEGNDAALMNWHLAKNPTLLSDRQLDDALRQFAGKIDGDNTHRDLAMQFLKYSKFSRCYGTFKDELYEYLITSVDPKYGRHHFNQQLYQHLQDTLSYCDSHHLNDFLLIETCKKLLNFLIVESPYSPNHSRFVDLTGNIGIVLTISLLLKIVLLCRAVKPWLERRFAILFKLHEENTTDKVDWLVDALEHLNVALSTNFGTIKLTY